MPLTSDDLYWLLYTGGGAKAVATLQPWQFTPEQNGAKGDGRIVRDAAITSGQPTLTSATAGFTSADQGKAVMINGAGSGGFTMFATISAFVNATTVTLSANAGTTVTGASMLWGTDDTAAFQALSVAMGNYIAGAGNNFKAQAILSNKIYCLAGTPFQTGNGTTTPTQNALFPMPMPPAAGNDMWVPEVIGIGDASQFQYFQSAKVNVQGSVLAAMSAPAVSGTFGTPSVIGGPSAAAAFSGSFANLKPYITGVTILCPVITNWIAYDFRYCAGFTMNYWQAQVLASVTGDLTGIPLGNLRGLASFQAVNPPAGVGLYSSLATNNDQCDAGTGAVEGFPNPIAFSEHFTASRIALIYSNISALVDLSGGTVIHGGQIGYLSSEQTNTVLKSNGGGGTQYPIIIGLMDVEIIATADINDPSNTLTGLIHWADFGRSTPTITGGAALKVINDRLGPGHMASPPAVPASTANAALVYRDAWVTIHTGVGVTVSAITIDGTATGLTMAASSSLAVLVPSGKTIAMTYAGGTPTWDWWAT